MNPKIVLDENQEEFTINEVFQNFDIQKISADVAHDFKTGRVKALMEVLNRHGKTDAEVEAFLAGMTFQYFLIVSEPEYGIAVLGAMRRDTH